MNIAISATTDDLRSQLVIGTAPFLAVVSDLATQTRIELEKDTMGNEVISFRTQGERLAVYQRPVDEEPVIRILPASSEIDLSLFWDKISKFYSECPELRDYIAAGTDRDSVLDPSLSEYDRTILVIVFGESALERN